MAKGVKLQNGVVHMVADNNFRFEPMRTNNFEFYIPGLSNIKYRAGSENGPQKYISANDIILAVKDVTPPKVSLDTLQVKYGNGTANYAGVPSFETSSITFNDFLGIDVARALEAWFQCAFDLRTHKIHQKKDYAFPAYLIEYTPDGEVTRTWKLCNTWINSFELGAYDNEDSSIRRVTCSFVYDWFEPSGTVR